MAIVKSIVSHIIAMIDYSIPLCSIVFDGILHVAFWNIYSIFNHFSSMKEQPLKWMDRTGKNSGGQVNILGTFPKERLNFCLFSLALISGTVGDRQK